MYKEIKKNLRELGFSYNESKVYLALTRMGESMASKIAKRAEVPRTTAISILDKLEKDGYISTNHYKGVTYYWIESPEVLRSVFSDKMKIADNLKNILSNLYRAEANFPTARIYDTKSSIKIFVEKTLHTIKKHSVIYTIDTPHLGNYHKVFSDSLNNIVLDVKKERGILTHTLIPHGSFTAINPEKIKRQNIIIRELPENIDFKASLWVIDNLLVLFSGRPPFVVAVSHKLIVDSMKSIYDFLWQISTNKSS